MPLHVLLADEVMQAVLRSAGLTAAAFHRNVRAIATAEIFTMTTTYPSKTTWQDRLGDRWEAIKLPAIALAIGLIAGPLISNFMGWQVSRGTADRQSHTSAVHQQALVCAAMARAGMPDTASLDWSARRELGEKFAVMPGRTVAEPDVASACADILAKA